MSQPLAIDDLSVESAAEPRWLNPAIVLIAVVLLAYSSSFGGQFQFDDFGDFVNRPSFQIWEGLAEHLTTSNRPAGAVTFAINRAWHGVEPFGYHVVNLSIHLVSALTLFSLVRWFLRQSSQSVDASIGCARSTLSASAEWLAAATAMLWAVHPLTTQAVTYIVQRYESLAAMFTLLTLRAFVSVAQHGGWSAWLGLTACAWLGVWSKEPAAMLPFLVATFDWVFTRERWMGRRRLQSLAYLLVASPYLWFVPSVARWILPDPAVRTSMGFNLKHITPWEYLRSQAEVLLHYGKLIFWPYELCFDYAWPVEHNRMVYFVCGGIVLVICLLALVLTWRRRPAGWLLLAAFLYLAPTSSILPIADLAFEHRMYLPSAAIVVLVVLGLWHWLCTPTHTTAEPSMALEQSSNAGAARSFRGRYALFSCLITCAIIACAARTYARNFDYHDDERLWSETLRMRPENGRAALMLAVAKSERGDWEEARRLTAFALKKQPRVAEFHLGYAECLRHFDEIEKALPFYSAAIELRPDMADAYQRRGYAYETLGRRQEAEADFREATRLGNPEGKYNLATLLLRSQRFAHAAHLFEELTREQPKFDRSYRRLAWILATAPDDAVRNGQRALMLLRDDYKIEASTSAYGWDTYAAALAEVGQFDEAIVAVDRAIELAEQADKPDLARLARERRARYALHQPHRDDGTDQDGDSRPQPAQLSIPARGAGA